MPEMITDSDAQYAFDIVKFICTKIGPGMPGTSQERERAETIKNEFEAHLGAGHTTVEEFTVAPWAFLSAYPMSAFFMLIATLLNISMGHFTGVSPWLTTITALVFSVISSLLFIFEFVLGFELVDPFFRKKQSVNVVGTLRKPGTVNVKRLLILSGHHDSAPENTWLGFLGYGFFFFSTTWLIGFITILAVSIIQLTGIITGSADLVRIGTIRWGILAYPIAPSVVFGLFFNRGRKNGGTVPGAVDNLSACALTVAMCRFLLKNPSCIPDDTEIRFISFGSEEAGCRGSRRYMERHLEELKRMDARLLNFETITHSEPTILTSDANGTVKNSPEMVKSVVIAAARAGVPYKVMPAYLGVNNDSGSFNKVGLKAATLLGFKVPQQMVAFYHQKRDTPEVLTIEPLLNVLKLTLEWVRYGGEGE